MKVSHKTILISSVLVTITFTLFSYIQYNTVKNALNDEAANNISETSTVISEQISNWLNGKLALIDMVAEDINADFSKQSIQSTINNPVLADNFILMFGGLKEDGKPITNDPSWNPQGWDARVRPWYTVALNNNSATLTDPYQDAATKEILISAVAKLSDKGDFQGAFGGDLSLKVISQAINKVTFNDTGYAFLINSNASIISHPNTALNGKDLADLFTSGVPDIRSDLQEIMLDSKAVLTSYQPLEGLKGSRWYVGVVLDKSKVLKEANKFGIAAIIGTILSVLLTSLALFFTLKALFKPLDALQSSLVAINNGNGDLTSRLSVTTSDEFGKVSTDFNEFIEYLQNIILEVKRISVELKSSTLKSASSAENTATSSLKQLNELDMLSMAITQLSSSAQEIAENAQQAASAATAADTSATEGAGIVSQTTASIIQLVAEMDETAVTINQLEKYSTEIESVLISITNIAQQTNLLALNAAIEAARAGEQGRGFAVVADEVRALAARTQQSTTETTLIIESLQRCVQTAVDKIQQSRLHANRTSEDSQKADIALRDIRQSISKISDITNNIASSVHQQSITSEEISNNTANIKNISQGVSDQAQDQRELSAIMVGHTEEQENVLKQFKV